MKHPKLLFIILTFATTTFYGCKKDVELMTDPLVGKYKGTYKYQTFGIGPYVHYTLDTIFSITKIENTPYYRVLGFQMDPKDTRYPEHFSLNENGLYLFFREGAKRSYGDTHIKAKRISNLP